MKHKIIGSLLLFCAAASWGGTYVISKVMLASIPVFSLLLGRYAVAFLALWVICKLSKVEPVRGKDVLLVLPGAVIGYFASMALQFWGTDLSGASMASLIAASSTLFVLIFAAILLKEKMTARKIFACLIGFCGVALVIGFGAELGGSVGGCLVVVAHAVTWALMTVMFKKTTQKLSTLAVTTCALKIAVLCCIPVSIWEMVQHGSVFYHNSAAFASVLYMGLFATALGFYAWNKGMTMMDAGVGSLFLYFQPMVSALLGWGLLHEQLNWSFAVGGILLVLAVAVSIDPAERRRKKAERKP